jgi:Protein of unknown function (DUF2889)
VELAATPMGPSPERRNRSVRRTSSIHARWPSGLGRPTVMRGCARDLLTDWNRASSVLALDSFEIVAAPDGEILSIATNRNNSCAQGLVGHRGGGRLRAAIAEHLPDEVGQSTPLHLLLDDYTGAQMVSPGGWIPWDAEWMETRKGAGVPLTAGRNGRMDNVCIGFASGASALLPDGSANQRISNHVEVPPLNAPGDPYGWHDLPDDIEVRYRRARRMDVWQDDVVHVDASFQDSAMSPTGRSIGIHEYRVFATASPDHLALLTLHATPHILPYRECPGAVKNIHRLVGTELAKLRQQVRLVLPGTLGCTHLNDVLRMLADVPVLARTLRDRTRRVH